MTRRAALTLLFIIQGLSWSGMFMLWIYAVPVVTRFVLHADAGDGAQYRQGLVLVSACFAWYAVLAASLAFALPRLTARFGAGSVHGVALLIGGAGLASLARIDSAPRLFIAFTAIGIAWCSISNLPYAMLGALALPGKGAALIRIFGFSTVLPQVAVTLGLAIAGEAIFGTATNLVMLVGGGLMGVAGLLMLAVRRRFNAPLVEW